MRRKKTRSIIKPPVAERRPAIKQAIRFYLKDQHERELRELVKTSGLTLSAFLTVVIEDWLDQRRAFQGKTEMEALLSFIESREQDPALEAFASLLSKFVKRVEKRRVAPLGVS
jgi:hypothetical protein